MEPNDERQQIQAERADVQAKLDRNQEHGEALQDRLRQLDEREAELDREPVREAPDGEQRDRGAQTQDRAEYDAQKGEVRSRDDMDRQEQMAERAGDEQATRGGGAYGPDPRQKEYEEQQRLEREDEERER